MEVEHGHLELLRIEKAQTAASGRVTEGFLSRERGHATTLRKLHHAWEYWQSRGGEGEERLVAPVEQIMRGEFPWEPTGQPDSSEASLRLSLLKAVAELFRSKEEVLYLKSDSAVLVSFYMYQRTRLMQYLQTAGAELSAGALFLVLSKMKEVRGLAARARKVFDAIPMPFQPHHT
jgi:hypothetical protein